MEQTTDRQRFKGALCRSCAFSMDEGQCTTTMDEKNGEISFTFKCKKMEELLNQPALPPFPSTIYCPCFRLWTPTDPNGKEYDLDKDLAGIMDCTKVRTINKKE